LDPDSCISYLQDLCDGVTVVPPSMGAIIALILAILLLYASGFVSASEIAFFSLSPSDLSKVDENEHPSDSRIRALLDDSERLLATILISNNFVNVTIIMLCNFFFASVIDFGDAQLLAHNGCAYFSVVAFRGNHAENIFCTKYVEILP
jgi:putative hemolysin